VRAFDRKFGPAFLDAVPRRPGVYRLYDAGGTLLYVGKAADLRRRLAQYRTTRRVKRDGKRRALVTAAARIAWDVCASETEAALLEVRLIQSLRPRANVAGAFPFLYPFIGLRADARETRFCLTTSPGAFAGFELHGAFRSRRVTGEAFFALMRLLRFVGHLTPRPSRARVLPAPHSYVFAFRRLPVDWPALCGRLLRGVSRDALEDLALRLVDQAGARARRGEVQQHLDAVRRFFAEEASPLAAAIAATGYARYPVPQHERDALLLRYRDASRLAPAPTSRAR
jgi:excinuclease ABC subunit C